MIDYGMLPPEINSTRMYTGAGAGPMLAAAAAWTVLAEELSLTAASFELTVLDLVSGPWRGPSSLAMAAAALPFTTWFKATAAQAAHAAGQAGAAAAAFEAAFAMTVPPPLVFANRAQLMTLIATNFFGQNTPAIAATEAQYAAMWAQDATAMYTYAGTSSAASKFSEFTAPPQTTSPVGDAGATAPGAGTPPPTPPTTLPSPLPAPSPTTQALLQHLTTLTGYANSALGVQRIGDSVGQELNGWETAGGGYTGVRDMLAAGVKAAEAAPKSVGTAAARLPGLGSAPTATLARGVQIGGLSVPASWPVAPSPAAATTVGRVTATAAEGLPRGAFGVPGIPGMAGKSATGGVTGFRFVPRYGYRHQMMMRPPSAG